MCSPASLCSKLKGALDEVDVVVTSGGVSMGERVGDTVT